MKNDKMSKRKKAITDYFMQSKKLNKAGEDSMKTCQIMLFGVGIAAYPFFLPDICCDLCERAQEIFSVKLS